SPVFGIIAASMPRSPVIALFFCLSGAHAQLPPTYTPTPVDTCFSLSGLRFGAEHGSAASPLPHELTPKLAEGIAACEEAVKTRPEGRLFGGLARLRLLAGDAKGGLEAARKSAELKSATGQVLLGVMYVDGVHLPRDYAAARELFRL